MRLADDDLKPAEIIALAERWFARQVEILSASYGPSWPEHKEWIEDYLRGEIRQRLIERGWRPKR